MLKLPLLLNKPLLQSRLLIELSGLIIELTRKFLRDILINHTVEVFKPFKVKKDKRMRRPKDGLPIKRNGLTQLPRSQSIHQKPVRPRSQEVMLLSHKKINLLKMTKISKKRMIPNPTATAKMVKMRMRKIKNDYYDIDHILRIIIIFKNNNI